MFVYEIGAQAVLTVTDGDTMLQPMKQMKLLISTDGTGKAYFVTDTKQ